VRYPKTSKQALFRQFGITVILFAEKPDRVVPRQLSKLPQSYVPVGPNYCGLTSPNPKYINAREKNQKGFSPIIKLLVIEEIDNQADGLILVTIPVHQITIDE
jgi:hypothetical protein